MPYKDKERRNEWYRKNWQRRKPDNQQRRANLREQVYMLKHEAGCKVCGEKDPRCLEYHHLDPKQKEYNIAHAVGKGVGMEVILEEIKKCIVLCANCHRKEHLPLPKFLEFTGKADGDKS